MEMDFQYLFDRIVIFIPFFISDSPVDSEFSDGKSNFFNADDKIISRNKKLLSIENEKSESKNENKIHVDENDKFISF
jgi:hypothetical protein